jgi:hypothetical protein
MLIIIVGHECKRGTVWEGGVIKKWGREGTGG